MTTESIKRDATHKGQRRITTAATLLLVGGAMTVSTLVVATPAIADPPRPPGKDGPYLAIAWSPDNGAHGWANARATVVDAEQGAIGYCQHYGGDQCKVVVSTRACGALFAAPPDTQPSHTWGPAHTGTGPTPDAAQSAAISPNGVPVENTGVPLIIRCATGNAGQG